MSDKIRQLKDEAAAWLRKGKHAKALKLYQKVLQADPGDYSVYNNMGYLYRRLGHRDEAVEIFTQLTDLYAEQGFLLKAVATCKVVLEIDPDHKKTQQKLAGLYARHTDKASLSVKIMEDPEDDARREDAVEEQDTPVPIELNVQEAHDFGLVLTTPLDVLETIDTLPEEEQAEEEAQEEAEEVEEEVEEDALPEIDLDVMQFEETSGQERTLPAIPLFSDLAPDAFVSLLEKMKLIRVKTGDWVVREGARGDSMFAIASGAVRVLKHLEGKKMLRLAVLGEGDFFGEMSVIRGGPRGASVQATKPAELFEVSSELLDEIVALHPAVGLVLKKFITQRLLRNVMTTSALFAPFAPEERVRIIERFVSRDVEEGEELIAEGKETEGLFVVLRGKMTVSRKADDGTEFVAGELVEGEVFGEISCLRKQPAIATVRAAGPSSVLRLPRKDFDALVLSHPQILELVGKLGEQRLALTMNALARKGILI